MPLSPDKGTKASPREDPRAQPKMSRENVLLGMKVKRRLAQCVVGKITQGFQGLATNVWRFACCVDTLSLATN